MKNTFRYCGRTFTESELEDIRGLIAGNPSAHRARLSRLVCDKLEWRSPNGRVKEMSCRVAMLRMQDDGLIKLPPPLRKHTNAKLHKRRTLEAEPDIFPITLPASELTDLNLTPVSNQKESYLWNEYIDRYHYLGYKPLPGAQIRYFVRTNGQIIALFGFGAAAWKTAPRDNFIGWTHQQRQKNLHLVVNNARFLILPWVKSKCLASKLLSMAAKILPESWIERYNYSPVLLETFVQIDRFSGTCYKAANWVYLGETKGRGKLYVKNRAELPKKSVWVYPLRKDFRQILCS